MNEDDLYQWLQSPDNEDEADPAKSELLTRR